MTLNDITVGALAQLDRGHDAQSLDTWRDKFARFANDAVNDLFSAYRPRTSQSVVLRDGGFDTSALTRECIRVCSVVQGKKQLRFAPGGAGRIMVDGSGTAEVVYRYAPHPMTSPTDTPELPEWMHGLIVMYVVARERAAGDASLQRGCSIYFQMYEAGKRAVGPDVGDAESFSILNRW